MSCGGGKEGRGEGFGQLAGGEKTQQVQSCASIAGGGREAAKQNTKNARTHLLRVRLVGVAAILRRLLLLLLLLLHLRPLGR